MKHVYIAGPFRGENAWEIACNVRDAETLALEVARMGAVPVCPHKMFSNFQGVLPDAFWLEATEELLKRCDGVVFLSRWEASEGSRREQRVAVVRGIPNFYAPDLSELRMWLAGG